MRRTAPVVAALLAAATTAHAQDDGPTSMPASRPFAPPVAGEAAPRGDKHLGPRVGVAIGMLSGVAPGGLRLGGALSWRVADQIWIDAEGALRWGAGGAACFTGRGDDRPLTCEHGLLDGTAIEALAGARLPLGPWPGGLDPYVHAGVGLQVISFADDDVTGVSMPLWGGFGGRYPVDDGLAIVGEATLTLGPGWFDGLDVEPISTLIVQGGVDFDL